LHLANGKLYFELLEILSAAQNDLPFQGEKASSEVGAFEEHLWSK